MTSVLYTVYQLTTHDGREYVGVTGPDLRDRCLHEHAPVSNIRVLARTMYKEHVPYLEAGFVGACRARVGHLCANDGRKPVIELGAQGPVLPPMEPGLPHTDMKSIRRLFLAVLVRGITEDPIGEWVGGKSYHQICELAGLEKHEAIRLKNAYAKGTLDLYRLSYLFVGFNKSADASDSVEVAERAAA